MSRTNKEITGHRPFYLISAEKEDLSSRDNFYRTCELEERLIERKYSFKEVQGCYKGVKEVTFLVGGSPNDGTRESYLLELAKKFSQESILKVGEDNRAYLILLDLSVCGANGIREVLGSFTEVSKKEAIKEDNYTQEDGRYYIVRGEG